ncbi:hypothetical protein Q7C36_014689 [Tachysurus vachellii]|uniref:Bcl-2 Bcl-2 homology region 1-3 domain-containing protein n=1 Tax=Tachysurus vachellii TaxID=175792 RepID=A0AA88MAR5_TACVA|nr:induced myeloid leukemia cell differentiation protein Mcl-1 homolog [Tachysurus vachellii]KAK2833988.1 hypothetical protein Q7C36_014689 [Tachysurus vachellii]
MSMMKRSAPFTFLCCGDQNGGRAFGAVSRFNGTLETLSQKREDELDGETEPTENRVLLQDLEQETRELLGQFYRLHIGLIDPSARIINNNKAHRALKSLQGVVNKLLCDHRITYNGMVQRLFEQTNGLDSVSPVLSGVFSDGVISWGRVASVLALGAVVCERLKQDGVKAEECVDKVTSKISSFISTELQHWFINNNSWDGFVEFFHVEDPESTVRNTLVAVAGLGLGVCLLTLMR